MAKTSRSPRKKTEAAASPITIPTEISNSDLVSAAASSLIRRWPTYAIFAPIVATLLVAGLTRINLTEIATNATFLASICLAGAVAVIIAFFLFYLILVNQETQCKLSTTLENHKRVAESSESLIDHLRDEGEQVAQLTEDIASLKTELRKNAEFVPDGFIGLQRRAIEIESISETEAPLLYAIYGHLPSHIRTHDLEIGEARQLYQGWTPDRLLPDYVNLINRRRIAHADFVAKGGECWEFFNLSALENYAEGRTGFDPIIDARAERKTRFERLRQLLDEKRCNICIFKRPIGNSLLLRTPKPSFPNIQMEANGALLLDLRLPDSVTNFNESCYGIYSRSPWTVSVYLKKVEALLSAARRNNEVIDSKEEIKKLVNKWIVLVDRPEAS